jgi:type II secretory pathway pseudopilin PulG
MKQTCSLGTAIFGRGPARFWSTVTNLSTTYCEIRQKARAVAAFSLVEAMVGISVLGIGIASTVGALTKFNSIASISRNATGAYAAVMNQIDLIQSDAPFNPQKQKTNPDGTAQIPPELQLGTQTQNNVPVYQDPNTGVVVSGTMTTTVSDISSTYTQGSQTFPLTMYQAVVTVTYTYLNRNYSFSMSTIRTSDI